MYRIQYNSRRGGQNYSLFTRVFDIVIICLVSFRLFLKLVHVVVKV